ncbi:MAG: YqgE/AlgH family protein [Flavobacteriales bacterium]|nr:YqgE/AlgH family protein [Flavobacteriales bacterium]
MIDNGEMVADDIRFLIGYTGWATHQLEEVKMNDKLSYSWQHADAWEKTKFGWALCSVVGIPP